MPPEAGTQLSAPQASAGGTRRMPALRLSKAAGGRFPLSAVPRRTRCRARAEAPGRDRRRSDRRVRGEAREGASREQSRHWNFAVEWPKAASFLGSLLVAAPGPRAGFGTGMALVAHEWEIAPPLLNPPLAVQARRLRWPRLDHFLPFRSQDRCGLRSGAHDRVRAKSSPAPAGRSAFSAPSGCPSAARRQPAASSP